MTEPLPEQQKTTLIVRSPLSEDGSISIYFSSRDGRLMSQEEWWHLKELVELGNRMWVKQKARSQTAWAGWCSGAVRVPGPIAPSRGFAGDPRAIPPRLP